MMKRILIIAGTVASLMLSMASAQTLADAARAQQKNKRTGSATGKVYTNDSLGFHPGTDSSSKSSKDDSKKDADSDSKSDKKTDDAASAEDKKKEAEEFKTNFDKQKAELAQLQRELDLLTRENRLRGAAFYADAGTRLRDEKKFADDDRKFQADMAAKNKAIQDAKDKLDKMRDEARRKSIPVS
jgi:hypothetical protein